MRSLKYLCLMAATGIGAAMGFSGTAQAAACVGVNFGAPFSGSYSCNSLGTPTGVTGNLGGITFLNDNTLLVGGNANGGTGYISQIGVTRDANNHVIGFSGPSSVFATAPNIDGGLSFGPGGVLFATGYPNNTLIQIKPGSTTPDKIITLDPNVGSVGALMFVPNGFAGAGDLKIVSYSNGRWVDATLTPDGTGTYNVSLSGTVVTLSGGPEGMVYVDGSNAGFAGADSLLVSEYGSGKVGAYTIDAFGNPILGSRKDFITGLSGAEGAVIDPLTGDFLFSTFGGGNQLLVISGFVAPPPPTGGVPEPASWAMMIVGLGAVGAGLRRAPKTTRVRFA